MKSLYHEEHFTFRFADDRIIPRFHVDGVAAGCPVTIFRLDKTSEQWLDVLRQATVGDGGWVDLEEPICVRAGEGFVVVPTTRAVRTGHPSIRCT